MIRRANIEDALAIANLDAEIFEDSLGYDFIESDFRLNPFARYYVYENENEIVGYIIFWVSDNTSILNFGVKKECRKEGIGSMLFDEVLKEQEGIISLEVRISNLNAINFYKNRNFKEVRVRKNYYSNGEDAILMVRM
jgi:ribosomal-protein-alanine N-acetyltransferase